jgi:hypothetical protein
MTGTDIPETDEQDILVTVAKFFGLRIKFKGDTCFITKGRRKRFKCNVQAAQQLMYDISAWDYVPFPNLPHGKA